jgi:hypothetical protein
MHCHQTVICARNSGARAILADSKKIPGNAGNPLYNYLYKAVMNGALVASSQQLLQISFTQPPEEEDDAVPRSCQGLEIVNGRSSPMPSSPRKMELSDIAAAISAHVPHTHALT